VNYSMFYRMPVGRPTDRYRAELLSHDFGYDEVTKRFRPPPMGAAAELGFFASRSKNDSTTFSSIFLAKADSSGGLTVDKDASTRTLSRDEDMGVRYAQPFTALSKMLSTFSAQVDFKHSRKSVTEFKQLTAQAYANSNGVLIPVGPPFIGPSTKLTAPSVAYVPISLGWSG